MADGRREELACRAALSREGSYREEASSHAGPGAPELACPHPGHCQLLLDYRLARGRALAPADHEAARYELFRGRVGLSASLQALPYICGAIAMVFWARMSDRGTDRTFY